MDPQKQPTQCGDDFCHRYSCYIGKKEFDDGASLAAHDKIYYCGHCHIQFSYKSSLADHNKETHTNGQDDLVLDIPHDFRQRVVTFLVGR